MHLQTCGDFKSPTGKLLKTSGHPFQAKEETWLPWPGLFLLEESSRLQGRGFQAVVFVCLSVLFIVNPWHVQSYFSSASPCPSSVCETIALGQSCSLPQKTGEFCKLLKRISKLFHRFTNSKQELVLIIPEMFLSQPSKVQGLSVYIVLSFTSAP